MNSGPQALEIFGLTLHVESLEEGYRARALYRFPALTAGLTFWPSEASLRDLLAQIERQYHDFTEVVAWRAEAADKLLEVTWRLDSLGRLTDGRVVLADGPAGWRIEGRLNGDQSYLPGIAMGLQLALRS